MIEDMLDPLGLVHTTPVNRMQIVKNMITDPNFLSIIFTTVIDVLAIVFVYIFFFVVAGKCSKSKPK